MNYFLCQPRETRNSLAPRPRGTEIISKIYDGEKRWPSSKVRVRVSVGDRGIGFEGVVGVRVRG